MKYVNVKDTAAKWNLSERSIRDYCNKGKIPGCKMIGKTWFIPFDAVKPDRKQRSVSAKTLLDILREEQKIKLPGRIYHYLQVEMTYNSNHIEGSKLTHDQTRFIFETKTLGQTDQSTKIDDIIETINHFRCIDYVIENADKKLTESFIKNLHYVLKSGTTDAQLDWFNVGEYKKLSNVIGELETSKPNNVKKDMEKLLDSYNKKENIKIEDIIDFHYMFECIHPFQDGNGRVGRLIILKECLKYNIVPILIKDEFKDFYYRGLKEYKHEKGYLIDTCLHGQDIFKEMLDKLDIKL